MTTGRGGDGPPPIEWAIYSAKSTQDRNASIPEQLTDCREMVEESGGVIIGEFSDENFSAYSGNRGPGLESAKRRAVEAAERSGQIVMLVAQAHDRFARGAGDKPGAPQSLGELWHELRRKNVWLRTVEDDEELRDEASVAAIGRRAHIDSARKSKAVSKGRAAAHATAGRSLAGHAPTATAGPTGSWRSSPPRSPSSSASTPTRSRAFHRWRSLGR